MEIKGTFLKAYPVETGQSKAGKEFKKQIFVIETGGQFSKRVAFSLFGDKVDLINGCSSGANVTIQFDAESREWNDKYFTDLKCFGCKIEGTVNHYKPAEAAPASFPTAPSDPNQGGGDDLPF